MYRDVGKQHPVQSLCLKEAGVPHYGRVSKAWEAPEPSGPAESPHLLADLAGDVRLQPPCEDLVYDTVAVVGVAGLLPIIVT